MDRSEAIQILEHLKPNNQVYSANDAYAVGQALSMAINSLETDEAYQLMYEGEEIFTKADMVAMLTEIQLEIEECVDGAEGSPQFEQGVTIARAQVVEMIQQKINELKAESKENL